MEANGFWQPLSGQLSQKAMQLLPVDIRANFGAVINLTFTVKMLPSFTKQSQCHPADLHASNHEGLVGIFVFSKHFKFSE